VKSGVSQMMMVANTCMEQLTAYGFSMIPTLNRLQSLIITHTIIDQVVFWVVFCDWIGSRISTNGAGVFSVYPDTGLTCEIPSIA